MVRRFPDWAKRLDNFIQANLSRPFQREAWNCGSFAAGAILSMTGLDIKDELYGMSSNSSNTSAIALRTARKFGLISCSPLMARQGDPVLLGNLPIGTCMGIIGMRGVPLKVTDHGIILTERKDILRAWHLD